jgi:hypothetical protein
MSYFPKLWNRFTNWSPRKLYLNLLNLQRALRFAKIGYRDRDWDQEFMWELLEFKLGNMENFFFSGEPWKANAVRTGKQIRTARILCGRIAAEVYCDMWPEYFLETCTYVDGTNRVTTLASFAHPRPPIGPFQSWKGYEHHQRVQDIEYLGILLRKHSTTWWD